MRSHCRRFDLPALEVTVILPIVFVSSDIKIDGDWRAIVKGVENAHLIFDKLDWDVLRIVATSIDDDDSFLKARVKRLSWKDGFDYTCDFILFGHGGKFATYPTLVQKKVRKK